MSFELPKLKYSFAELEPAIDAQTVEIHYTKHHQNYVNSLNKALETYPQLQTKTILELLSNLDQLPKEIATVVKNNGGGYYNHNLYWQIMSKNPNTAPKGKLAEKINDTFGGMASLKSQINQTGLLRFGSGWVWLVVNAGKLEVVSTANQDSPISVGKSPILALDVWEHAYYLKYQNRRADYLENWWKVLDWAEVETLYNQL